VGDEGGGGGGGRRVLAPERASQVRERETELEMADVVVVVPIS